MVFTYRAGALALALGIGGSVWGQEAPRPSTEASGAGLASGGTLAPAGGAVDTSQGGVGGTGLGKMPPGSTDGKGMSVKGPPGQAVRPPQAPK